MLVRDLLQAISSSCLSLDDEILVEIMYRDIHQCMESKKYIKVRRAGSIFGVDGNGFKICIEGGDF
jgi:hypothetical protein